jgi:hypothetical protein
MIATFADRASVAALLTLLAACGGTSSTPKSASPAPKTAAAGCIPSGDGYLRATVAGAINAKIDWPNSGTHCEGESRGANPGVHLSFQRQGAVPDVLLVFGLSQVKKGQPAHEIGANLTVILQGTDRFFGTQGESRCTVDSLSQRPLDSPGMYRVEARGFCTQPAHAVRGDGDVLVSTFEFAGPVIYEESDSKEAGAM